MPRDAPVHRAVRWVGAMSTPYSDGEYGQVGDRQPFGPYGTVDGSATATITGSRMTVQKAPRTRASAHQRRGAGAGRGLGTVTASPANLDVRRTLAKYTFRRWRDQGGQTSGLSDRLTSHGRVTEVGRRPGGRGGLGGRSHLACCGGGC